MYYFPSFCVCWFDKLSFHLHFFDSFVVEWFHLVLALDLFFSLMNHLSVLGSISQGPGRMHMHPQSLYRRITHQENQLRQQGKGSNRTGSEPWETGGRDQHLGGWVALVGERMQHVRAGGINPISCLSLPAPGLQYTGSCLEDRDFHWGESAHWLCVFFLGTCLWRLLNQQPGSLLHGSHSGSRAAWGLWVGIRWPQWPVDLS